MFLLSGRWERVDVLSSCWVGLGSVGLGWVALLSNDPEETKESVGKEPRVLELSISLRQTKVWGPK
jgi:hypothetical protein